MAERSVLIRIKVDDVETVAKELDKIGARGTAGLKKLQNAATPASGALRGVDSAARGTRRSIQGLGTSIAIIEGPLGGMAARANLVAASLGRVGLVATALIITTAALSFGFVAASRAAGEAEVNMLRLEAVLRATENASGLTGERINALSRDIGRNTLASTNDVRAAAAVLLTFRTIQEDTFERTLRLAQDMAFVFNQDLRSAVVQLSKALEDPVRGMTSLRRVGVSFGPVLEEQIKLLAESGQLMEAQGLILDRLAEQIGGAALGGAGGLAGAVDTLSESWRDLLEAMGETKPVQDALSLVTRMLDAIRRGLVTDRIEALGDEISRLERLFSTSQRLGAPKESLDAIREQINLLRDQIFATTILEDLKTESAMRDAERERVRGRETDLLGRIRKTEEGILALRVNRRARILEEERRELEAIENLRDEHNAELADKAIALTRQLTRGRLAQLPPSEQELEARREERRIDRLREANARLLETLRFEEVQLGRNAREQAVQAELRKLNTEATLEQRQEVERLAGEIFDANERVKQAKKRQEDWNRVLEEGADLIDDMRTPLEEYSDEVARINRLLQAGAIDLETYNRRHADLVEELIEADRWLSAAKDAGEAFAESFTDIITGAESAADALDNFTDRVLRILDELLIEKPLTDLFEGIIGDLASGDLLGSFSKSAGEITGGLGPGGGGGDIASQTAGSGFLGFFEDIFTGFASLFHQGTGGGRAPQVPVALHKNTALPTFQQGTVRGIRPSEILAIVRKDEEILNPAQSRAFREARRAGPGEPSRTVNLHGNLIGEVVSAPGVDPSLTADQIVRRAMEELEMRGFG